MIHKNISVGVLATYLLLLSMTTIDTSDLGPSVNQAIDLLYEWFYSPGVWLLSTLVYLLATWVLGQAKFKDMLDYVATQRWKAALTVLSAYWLLVALLLWSPSYDPTFSVVMALSCFIFPYLFPHRNITNPTHSRAGTLWLLGSGGQRLPVNAPELGAFILGAPGSGKTKFVIEPILYRMISGGYTGILYDYDFSSEGMGRNYSLSHLAYHCCQNFTNGKTRFVSINFENPHTTKRVNPLSPAYIKDRNKLSQVLRTLLLNMAPGQKEDFWLKNTYALLKGLTILFANRYSAQCTLPHIIIAGLQPVDDLMGLLQKDPEACLYASPVIDAYQNAPEQLAGVLANFKTTLDKLLDPAIFWVLSRDETPVVVNDLNHRTVVCLGNTPTKKESFGPILAMLVSFFSTNLYGHGRAKSFVMIDELPTLYLPHLSEIPATARKYGVSTVVALQNMAQLEKRYTAVGALEIQETFSNHFIGKSPHKVAKEWSERIGKREIQAESHTTSKNQSSKTVQEKDKQILTAQEAMDLGVGEFLGAVSASDQPFFRMKLQAINHYHSGLSYEQFAPLPTITKEVDLASNFRSIQKSVERIIQQEKKSS